MATEKSKLALYENYIGRLQLLGKTVINYHCPDCRGEIKTQAAPPSEVWDSLSHCPHCDGMHTKVTRGPNAYGICLSGVPEQVH